MHTRIRIRIRMLIKNNFDFYFNSLWWAMHTVKYRYICQYFQISLSSDDTCAWTAELWEIQVLNKFVEHRSKKERSKKPLQMKVFRTVVDGYDLHIWISKLYVGELKEKYAKFLWYLNGSIKPNRTAVREKMVSETNLK